SIVRRSASRICEELSTRILESSRRGGIIWPLRLMRSPSCARIAHALRFPPMAATVNVNGPIADQEHAVISVFDHGFLYGEGVYGPLRTYNGQPFLFERHMRRLRTSAQMLALAVPLPDQEIDARFRETMRAAGLGDGPEREAYLRMLVTRGVGELSYDP